MKLWDYLRRCAVHMFRNRTNEFDKKLFMTELPLPTAENFPETLMLYYKAKVLPIEKALNLDIIYPVSMNDCEFTAPATLLFLGPPSVGKTSMINYLLGCQFSESHDNVDFITDKFVIVMYNKHQHTIPSAALLGDQNFPYPGLSRFGNAFVKRCTVSYCPSEILKQVNIIDTPGIISPEKQKAYRGYDYESAITFFADRADKIILVFDVYKLDFSENVRRLLDHIQLYEEKITIVLNKIDSVEWQELDRIQECLMWYLSRAFRKAEVTQVYFGSFWERPLRQPELLHIVNRYQDQLLEEIRQLPLGVNIRRLNDVIRRGKLARTHALISKQMPPTASITQGKLGKYLLDKIMKKLTREVYPHLIIKHKIFFFDLPHPMLVKKLLVGTNPVIPQKVTNAMIQSVEQFLSSDITNFVQVLPPDSDRKIIHSGRLHNPLIGTELCTMDWCTVNADARKYHWREAFDKLNPRCGRLHASHVKEYLQYAGLPMIILTDIWRMVDSDDDELINEDEFCLLNWLVAYCKRGNTLPAVLPKALKPPESHNNPCENVANRLQEDVPQLNFWPRWE